jgi:hypothetical protein
MTCPFLSSIQSKQNPLAILAQFQKAQSYRNMRRQEIEFEQAFLFITIEADGLVELWQVFSQLFCDWQFKNHKLALRPEGISNIEQ